MKFDRLRRQARITFIGIAVAILALAIIMSLINK